MTSLPKAKAKYDFDMPSLRRRIKKQMRKKHKKTIKLSFVDKVWKEYVRCGIINPLINVGKIEIDKNFSLEIVGEKIVNNNKLFTLTMSGRVLKTYTNRDGIFYSIVAVDKNFKEGKLYFEPSDNITEKIHEALENTNNYYRILK